MPEALKGRPMRRIRKLIYLFLPVLLVGCSDQRGAVVATGTATDLPAGSVSAKPGWVSVSRAAAASLAASIAAKADACARGESVAQNLPAGFQETTRDLLEAILSSDYSAYKRFVDSRGCTMIDVAPVSLRTMRETYYSKVSETDWGSTPEEQFSTHGSTPASAW